MKIKKLGIHNLIIFFLINSCLINAKIQEINGKNFLSTIEKHNISLISFQNSSCYFCPQTLKNLEETDSYFIQSKIPIKIFTVDIDKKENKQLLKDYNVEDNPAVYITFNGSQTIQPYPFLTEPNKIITFTKKIFDNSIKNISTEEEIVKFLNPKENYVNLLIVNPNISPDNLKAFVILNSLSNFHDTGFCLTDICKKYFKISDYTIDFIIYYYEPKEEFTMYKFIDLDELIVNLFENALPEFTNFTHFALDVSFNRLIDSIFFVIDGDNNEDYIIENMNIYKDAVRTIFKKGQILSFIMNTKSPDDIESLEFFGYKINEINKLKETKRNLVFILSFKHPDSESDTEEKSSEYNITDFTEEFTKEKFVGFLKDYVLETTSIDVSKRKVNKGIRKIKKNLYLINEEDFFEKIMDDKKNKILLAHLPNSDKCTKCMDIYNIFYDMSDSYKKMDDLLFVIMVPFDEEYKAYDIDKQNPVIIIEYYDKKKQWEKYKGEYSYDKIKEFLEKGINNDGKENDENNKEEEIKDKKDDVNGNNEEKNKENIKDKKLEVKENNEENNKENKMDKKSDL